MAFQRLRSAFEDLKDEASFGAYDYRSRKRCRSDDEVGVGELQRRWWREWGAEKKRWADLNRRMRQANQRAEEENLRRKSEEEERRKAEEIERRLREEEKARQVEEFERREQQAAQKAREEEERRRKVEEEERSKTEEDRRRRRLERVWARYSGSRGSLAYLKAGEEEEKRREELRNFGGGSPLGEEASTQFQEPKPNGPIY